MCGRRGLSQHTAPLVHRIKLRITSSANNCVTCRGTPASIVYNNRPDMTKFVVLLNGKTTVRGRSARAQVFHWGTVSFDATTTCVRPLHMSIQRTSRHCRYGVWTAKCAATVGKVLTYYILFCSPKRQPCQEVAGWSPLRWLCSLEKVHGRLCSVWAHMTVKLELGCNLFAIALR